MEVTPESLCLDNFELQNKGVSFEMHRLPTGKARQQRERPFQTQLGSGAFKCVGKQRLAGSLQLSVLSCFNAPTQLFSEVPSRNFLLISKITSRAPEPYGY